MNQTTTSARIILDEVGPLATELVAELAEHIRDGHALNAVIREWLGDLGSGQFGLVASYALRTVFAECLTTTPIGAIPPASTVLVVPEETS